jgi:hypothetical protein
VPTIRLKFEVGFDAQLTEHRLTNLASIKLLLESNHALSLKSANLQKLHTAGMELQTFFGFRMGGMEETEAMKSLVRSSAVLLERLKSEGKLHKTSVQSLQKAVVKLEPVVAQLLEAEMHRRQAKTEAED